MSLPFIVTQSYYLRCLEKFPLKLDEDWEEDATQLKLLIPSLIIC